MSNSMTELLLDHQVTLETINLSYKPKSKQIKEHILKDVNARFLPGRLTAILGPSGAGKTSLLNVLTGFKDAGMEGSILVNGMERKFPHFRKIFSYIPQHFAMLEKLTVMETLQTSADLKIGLKIKSSVKLEIIKEIMSLLNLEKCCNTLVEQLSGGEKKRLSVGVELVTNPPIMIFDEPTSGLDSVSSLQMLTHLRKLAHYGRTVICVIHQPSSRILSLFDDALVLSEGECIYNGSLEQMVKHLDSEGFSCPKYYNPADYAVEVASKEHGNDLTSLIALNKINFSEDAQLTEVKIDENVLNSTMIKNELKSKTYTKNRSRDEYDAAYPVTFFEHFSILTKRTFRASIREKITFQIRFLIFPLFGLLLGAVFYDIGNDGAKVLTNASFIFFTIMFIYFGNSMPVVLSCPLETEVFVREHLSNWYSIGTYLCSKFVSDIPLQILCPTCYVGVAYFLTGQPNEAERFLMFYAICLLTGALGQAFGLFAGSTFGTHLSVFLVSAVSIPMLVFSGFFIRLNELSAAFLPLAYISYFRYSFEGAIQAIYGYGRGSLKCKDVFCYYRSPNKFLEDMDMSGDYVEFDVLCLIGFIVLFHFLFYISLIVKIKLSK